MKSLMVRLKIHLVGGILYHGLEYFFIRYSRTPQHRPPQQRKIQLYDPFLNDGIFPLYNVM